MNRQPGIPVSRCPDCGKVSYPSRSGARRSARFLYPGRRMRTYRCGTMWHLTSQNARTVTAWRDRAVRRRGEVAA